jgi:hypothetical protein
VPSIETVPHFPETLNSTLPSKEGSPLLSRILMSDFEKSGLLTLTVVNAHFAALP